MAEGGEIMVDIAVNVTQDGHRATVAIVTLRHEDVQAQVAGTALCLPEDTYDEEIGEALALGRAFRDLGRRLTREAMRAANGRGYR